MVIDKKTGDDRDGYWEQTSKQAWAITNNLAIKRNSGKETSQEDFSPSQSMVAHAFNPSAWEAEASRFLSSMLAWSTEQVPGRPKLYR